ncbi:uncharacterized protein CDAR_204671 [Caerostris darwini]|uniref:Uncharacterized protein n=1 Tax=Caerostris darwini TaxID=1538125 RepID=A0AAV4SY47_9ARAC|nr:uncharacterized protein CDAR_204671 [Caerostris darwini]
MRKNITLVQNSCYTNKYEGDGSYKNTKVLSDANNTLRNKGTRSQLLQLVHSELKFQRSDTGVPVGGISTRERVFGIPYDPRKDFDIPVPQRDIDRYLGENYETMDYRAVKEYATNKCCAKTCRCILGPNCRCRQSIDRKNNTRFKNCNNS